jgi:hypothetical protein
MLAGSLGSPPSPDILPVAALIWTSSIHIYIYNIYAAIYHKRTAGESARWIAFGATTPVCCSRSGE